MTTILIAVAAGALLFGLTAWMPLRGEGDGCGGGCLGCTEASCGRRFNEGGHGPAGRSR